MTANPRVCCADSCLKKVEYDTRKEASKKARELERLDGDRMDVYRCRLCRSYFVGHADPVEGRRRRRINQRKKGPG